MADHTEFLIMARKMIAEDGRQVTFAKLDATPADSNKPWNGPASPSFVNKVTTLAIFLPEGSILGFGDFNKVIKDDDLFKAADEVLLVAPPSTGENLADYNVVQDGSDVNGTGTKRITIIKELRPADMTVLYAMGVCR